MKTTSFFLLLALSCVLSACTGRPARSRLLAKHKRIVFLGDSITDGHTYPLLLEQALREAGFRVPDLINAGVAGDTAKDMSERLQRDVLSRQPTMVFVSAGINDVHAGYSVEKYMTYMRDICRRLSEKDVPVTIMTTTILGPKHEDKKETLLAYNEQLRDLARATSYRLAEIYEAMDTEQSEEKDLLSDDDIHLNFSGYRVMARALLDSLGCREVPVPEKLELSLIPGVVRHWSIRPARKDERPLNTNIVSELKPDDSWTELNLPQSEAMDSWWEDQERQRGFAQKLQKHVGRGGSYIGCTQIRSETRRAVRFLTGARLRSIWLNGKRIYHNTEWTGWHAGKERVPATLMAGENQIFIETGPSFFLAVDY
ncbi:MAG: hypothetical protein KGZ25_05575 [Planctomycetes bacterium]|nr:hypothetical protein [Planctomycetota bacterium]